jgi:hypothetical protein
MSLRHLQTTLHRLDFFQVALLGVQVVENAFAWPFDILKHRFIDIAKDAF